MSATSWLYVVVFFTGVFSILVVMMGFDKILKMIFGNYIVTIIILALGYFIDFEIKYINSNGTSFLGMTATELSKLLGDAKLTLLVAGYILLMIVWYKFSTFHVSLLTDEIKKRGFLLLTTPLCVTGVVLSLLIIILGDNVTNLGWILRMVPDDPNIRNFLMRIPLRIFIHGMFVIVIGLNINLMRQRVEHSRFTNEYE